MSLRKRLFGLATALAVGLLGISGVDTASADDSPIRRAPVQRFTLTVHKYLGATSSLPHDGTELTEEQRKGLTTQKPLQGVKFKLYEVEGVDISTNDGLKLAQQIGAPLTAEVVKNGITVGGNTYNLKAASQPEATTNSHGMATFEGRDFVRCLYVVVEDLAGSGDLKTADGAVDKAKVTPAAPFAVSVPMTKPDGKTLNWNVHVYPKNQVNELDKTVVDANINQGEDIVYTISTTSTGADTNGDGKMDKDDLGSVYEIVDTLDPNLTYKSVTVKVADQDVTAGENGYQVAKEETGDPKQDKVTVSFKGTTLDTIAGGAKVELKVTATVKSIPASGIIPNQATLYPNDWAKKNDKPVDSPKVETKYGDIVIKKVNKDNAPLAGAIFSVHLNTADAKDCSTYGTEIKKSEATGDNGLISIKGLHLTSFVDGKAVEQANQVPYCLVEKKAPSGYQLLPKPIKFYLTKEGTVAELTTAKEGDGNFVQITNYKNPGLPLTGAQGILLVSVLGLILVSAGVVLTVKRRKD